ncbi:MAG: T9SS type A sorting domain-containing protein [Candidatus Cloacimonetes bacterium]|nr:T9SS type A sorting domain-containing protein [Candidatus Cloacimonadota bacterium]
MKYLLLILLTLSVLHGYEWIPICTEEIAVYDLAQHFIGYPFVLACEDGLLIESGEEWIQINTGLPVWNILHYNYNEFLLVQGNGSYSDGVYKFNENSLEFEVIEWIVYPNFLVQNAEQEFYVGSYNGLYKSSDGEVWEEVNHFSGMNCRDMVFWNNHYAVSVSGNIYGVHYSDDYGFTWNSPSTGCPNITDIAYRLDSKLFGVLPDTSNSSGLWSSTDYGLSWQIEFYSDLLSSVNNDMSGNTFVGWEENNGVAIWSNESIIPMNEGLLDLSINNLFVNPIMSVIHMMAFTDNGAFMLTDYQVSSEKKLLLPKIILSNYPNPFNPCTEIRFKISEFAKIESINIEIYNLKGQLVNAIPVILSGVEGSVTWNGNEDNIHLSSGIYYYKLSIPNSPVKKMILLK